MSNRVVKATFANGRTVERGSKSKVYTHAYLATGKRPDGTVWDKAGFSTSEQQCALNKDAEIAWLRKQPGYTVDFEEVVAVEAIERAPQPTPEAA